MADSTKIQYRILIYDRLLSGIGCGEVPAVSELKAFSYPLQPGVEPGQELPLEVAYAVCAARLEYPQHTILLEEIVNAAVEGMPAVYERKEQRVREALDGLLCFSNELVERFQQGNLPSTRLEIRWGRLVIRQMDDPMAFEVDFSQYGPCSPEMLEELLHSKAVAKSPRVHEILEQQCSGIVINTVYFSYLGLDGQKKSLLFYRR